VRIAILSDVHGNLTALEAVVAELDRDPPDLVVHGGDLALTGGQPAEAVDLIRERGWPGVVGNTDEAVWRPRELQVQEARAPKLRVLLRDLFQQQVPATRDMLGDERIEWLRTLPEEWRAGELLLVHASPGDLWRAPMPDAEDDELREAYAGHDASVVVYGHIHQPYVRQVGELTVANSGSVGQPFDGDWRASYLLIEDGEPAVHRVEYDLEREVDALMRSGYPGAARLAEMRRTGRFVSP
jgi:putative phosphoesterase